MYENHILLALLISVSPVISAIIQPANSITSLIREPHLVTDVYTPKCHQIEQPRAQVLNATTCVIASEVLCQYLGPGAPRTQWIWVEQPGCAVAFYQPTIRYHEFRKCENLFAGIIDTCARDLRYNGGSVNVLLLPDFDQDGRAEDEGRNMYLLAPERLTL